MPHNCGATLSEQHGVGSCLQLSTHVHHSRLCLSLLCGANSKSVQWFLQPPSGQYTIRQSAVNIVSCENTAVIKKVGFCYGVYSLMYTTI